MEEEKDKWKAEEERIDRLLETILDVSPISIYIKDKDSRLLYVSRGFYTQYEKSYGKRFGLKLPPDVRGKTDFDLFLKNHAEKMWEDDRRVIEKGESIRRKLEHFTAPDGTEHYTLTTKIPRVDEKGNVVGLVGVSQDITDLIELEKELTRQRDMFKAILETAPISLYYKDKEGRLKLLSRGFYEQYKGYAKRFGLKPVEDATGKTDFDLFLKDHAEKMWEDDRRVMEKGERIINKLEYFTAPDGTEQYTLTSKLPITDEKGNVVGLVGTSIDVTEKMKLEKELSYERGMFENLMKNLPLSVYFKDRKGRLLRVSDYFLKLTPGAPPLAERVEEVIGKTDFDLFPEELAKASAEDEKRIIETKQPIIGKEERSIGTNGREIYLLSTKAPLLDENGNVVGIVGVTRDITERKLMEKKLEEGERRYRELVENSPVGIIATDENGVIVYENPAMGRILGVPEGEISRAVGTKLQEMPNVIAAGVDGKVRELLKGKPIPETTFPFTSIYGKQLSLSVIGLPLKDSEGRITGSLLLVQDITERKRAEEEVRFERNLLRSLLNYTPDLIWFMDKDVRYIATSKAHADYLGVSPEDMIGKTDLEFYPKEIAEKWIEHEKHIMKTGEPMIGKVEKIRSPTTGKELWVSTTKMPLYDEKGNVIGTFGISRDITKLKQAEDERAKALAEAAAGRIATEIIEGMSDGVVVTDLKGQIIQTNAASNAIFRTTKGESLGKHLTEFISEEEVPFVLDLLGRVIKTGEPVRNVEVTGIRKDGTKFPLLASGSLLKDREGKANRLLIVYRDITELKQAEEERAAAERARAEEAERFTKELQARVEELEKLHKLTVGRELKMMQMEREMEKLKRKLEELKKKPKNRK